MKFKIGNRDVGEGASVFIVAELSANHGGRFELAVDTIYAAAKAGADAIKVQTYTADTLTLDIDSDYFKIDHDSPWDGRTLHELYREAAMPWEWQSKLKEIAESLGLVFFSTPFDKTSVDFLADLDVPVYKVASFEIMDLPLIEHIADQGKPIIISTGIAELEDIERAIATCRAKGLNEIVLLKCTSSYPTPYSEVNLRTLADYAMRFQLLPGLSDHTLGIAVPVAAVALGAKIIEKHFILDRSLGGADASFSLEPSEFSEMVTAIRNVEQALGVVNYKLSDATKKSKLFGRSLFVTEEISEGEVFTEKNLRSVRPAHGLAPRHLPEVLGRRASKSIKRGTPLSWDLVDGGE